jgi:tRNA(Ile)-lysidine synthase
MYNRFLKYIKEEELIKPNDKLLLGVSGGVDSVVLSNLIDQLGNQFSVAHCNFNLRGQESDDDEKFVVNLADRLGVKCYLSSFPTSEYASEKGISIEMAARELRYEWFENLREAHGFDWVVVGHHLDDVLETFLLNLSRGTGIRGLSGIKAKAGRVIRPLLFASRREIEHYAKGQEFQFRHDKSNDDTNIKRNKVRHDILPSLESLNPSFKKNLQRTIRYLNETEHVFKNQIEEVRSEIVSEDQTWVKISIEKLKILQPLTIYLYELLRPYHFNSETIEMIIQALDGIPGSKFFSTTHRLVVDREELIITPVELEEKALFYIEKDDRFIYEPLNLRISIERYHGGYRIPNSLDLAVFDYDKLSFPLVLRKWQKGEYFRPLGMAGFKKLSDFFVDEKYSIPEKENVWILASDNKVVWIVGKRIDDRFKLTADTKLVLRIEMIDPVLT